MCGLILRIPWKRDMTGVPEQVEVQPGCVIQTDAPIWSSRASGPADPVNDSLDIDIRKIVSWLMATNKDDRPTLPDVLGIVVFAIRHRDAAYYNSVPEEQDNNIQNLWWKFVSEPDAPAFSEVVDILS
jgi:hypothetical protein